MHASTAETRSTIGGLTQSIAFSAQIKDVV